jgi:hypothetical protein
VAIDVHSIGERMGRSVAIFAITPRSIKRATVGNFPASMSGCITFQSAASQPTSKTLRGLFAVMTVRKN